MGVTSDHFWIKADIMACFTTAVVFFLLAQCATTYARGIHISIYSPLSDPNTAMTFARTFVSNIAGCGEFGSQGTEDFDDIIQSMIQAQSSGKGRHDSRAKAKAMQMALASSIAELVVEESGGTNVQQKTNAAIGALRSALQSTTGHVDESFVHEIIELIQLFSEDQFNEVDTGGSGPYSPGGSGPYSPGGSGPYSPGGSGPYSPSGGPGGSVSGTEVTINIDVGGGGSGPSGMCDFRHVYFKVTDYVRSQNFKIFYFLK